MTGTLSRAKVWLGGDITEGNAMRALIPLAAVSVLLVSTPAVATDCLAYLAADAGYQDAIRGARADYELLTRAAVISQSDALAAAEADYQQAIRAVPDGMRRYVAREAHYDHLKSIRSAFQLHVHRVIDIAYHDAQNAAYIARGEAMKGVSVTDNDYSEKRRAAKTAETQAIAVAQAERESAVRVAAARRDAAIAAAREAFEQAEAAYDAALEDAASDLTNAQNAAQMAYEEAIKPAQFAYDVAVAFAEQRRVDAYVKAYASPLDGYRDIEGYDDSIVLKMAVHERKLCPD